MSVITTEEDMRKMTTNIKKPKNHKKIVHLGGEVWEVDKNHKKFEEEVCEWYNGCNIFENDKGMSVKQAVESCKKFEEEIPDTLEGNYDHFEEKPKGCGKPVFKLGTHPELLCGVGEVLCINCKKPKNHSPNQSRQMEDTPDANQIEDENSESRSSGTFNLSEKIILMGRHRENPEDEWERMDNLMVKDVKTFIKKLKEYFKPLDEPVCEDDKADNQLCIDAINKIDSLAGEDLR